MIQDWSSAEAISVCSTTGSDGAPESTSQAGSFARRQSLAPVGSHSGAATHLFNAMIAPLLNSTIKGTIWYQVRKLESPLRSRQG
jgi:hypothetical protein